MLATDVEADVGRYPPDVEAAVYFCCLEAMQNAGKHAGEGARVTITVEECDGDLCFEVADNGAGFDATSDAVKGHGFVNMADRLGAIGGTLDVESAPGAGTQIAGPIPLERSRRRRRGLTSGRSAVACVPELADERGTEVFLVDVRERAAVARVGGKVGLGVRRQQDDRDVGMRGADLARRFDAVDARAG